VASPLSPGQIRERDRCAALFALSGGASRRTRDPGDFWVAVAQFSLVVPSDGLWGPCTDAVFRAAVANGQICSDGWISDVRERHCLGCRTRITETEE